MGEDLQEAAGLWVVPALHHLTGASGSVGPMDLSYLDDIETRTILPSTVKDVVSITHTRAWLHCLRRVICQTSKPEFSCKVSAGRLRCDKPS